MKKNDIISVLRNETREKTLRTLIIDDEEHQRHSLERLVKMYCPTLSVVGQADGVKTGIEAIIKYKPDLVLLDIKMNDGLGFDILEQLKPLDFKVIFITAYEKYADKAFRFSSLDYLLKPIDPDELMHAVNKAGDQLRQDFDIQFANMKKTLSHHDKADLKIVLKTYDSIYLVSVSDILFCESDISYTRFHLADKRDILACSSLKEYEDLLSESGFYRVHKDYIINIRYIRRFEEDPCCSVILEGEHKIPVESRKRYDFLEILARLAKKRFE